MTALDRGQILAWIGTNLQEPNWDSYGAEPLSDATIRVAAKVAELLASADFAIAVVSGGLTASALLPLRLTNAVPTNDGGVALFDADEIISVRITVCE